MRCATALQVLTCVCFAAGIVAAQAECAFRLALCRAVRLDGGCADLVAGSRQDNET